MSLSPVIPFVCVFGLAVIFTVLLFIYRSKIFGPLWGVLGCVCWFALAGLNIGIFEEIAFGVSWLFFALGIVCLVAGVVFGFMSLAASKRDEDFSV
jgi:hypothetical protein